MHTGLAARSLHFRYGFRPGPGRGDSGSNPGGPIAKMGGWAGHRGPGYRRRRVHGHAEEVCRLQDGSGGLRVPGRAYPPDTSTSSYRGGRETDRLPFMWASSAASLVEPSLRLKDLCNKSRVCRGIDKLLGSLADRLSAGDRWIAESSEYRSAPLPVSTTIGGKPNGFA